MRRYIMKTVLAACVCTLTGCSDTWDDHYTDNSGAEGGHSLLAEIKSHPELSTFAEMIETAGYEDLLSSSQTFTVWAPVNEALADVDMNDKAAVTRTLINHIARFNISSATPAEEGVKMLNGKLMYFSDDASQFGGAKIKESDIRVANGLVHELTTAIPYAYNFREYIDIHDNTTSFSKFLAKFDEELLASQVPGNDNADANDNELVSYNRLLQYPDYGLGNIAAEDSVFSMVIPTDVAWAKAYDRIKPYFVNYNEDQAIADSIQDQQTSLAIISDLIFRTGLRNPLEMDSVMSTSGSVISNPALYFGAKEQIAASNGRIFLADNLDYDMTETFNKRIRIEAEEQTGRTPAAGTTVYTRNVSTDNEFADEISGQRYIEVFPVSSSRQPGITFSVPDILAGDYDIYATFVPANVSDPTNVNDSTRVQFAVTYRAENGKNQSKSFNSNDFVTSGTKMTTIKVASGFHFPVSNYYDRVWYMDPKNDPKDRVITTSIYVSTNVSNSEFNQNVLSRRFRIDRIVLVPVSAE